MLLSAIWTPVTEWYKDTLEAYDERTRLERLDITHRYLVEERRGDVAPMIEGRVVRTKAGQR